MAGKYRVEVTGDGTAQGLRPQDPWGGQVTDKNRFKQAGIPSDLADEIMQFAEEQPWLGYRSLSNFVTTGARRLLQEARMEAYQKRVLKQEGDMKPGSAPGLERAHHAKEEPTEDPR